MIFLKLSDMDSRLSQTDFTLFIRSARCLKSDGSAEGNMTYLQPLNYRSTRDLDNYVEICEH